MANTKNKKQKSRSFSFATLLDPFIQMHIFGIISFYGFANLPDLDASSVQRFLTSIGLMLIIACPISTLSRTLAEQWRLRKHEWQSEEGYILPPIPSFLTLYLRSLLAWFVYVLGIGIYVALLGFCVNAMIFIGDRFFSEWITTLTIIFIEVLFAIGLTVFFIPVFFHKVARIIVDYYLLKREGIIKRTYIDGEDKVVLIGHSYLLSSVACWGLLFITSVTTIMNVLHLVSPFSSRTDDNILPDIITIGISILLFCAGILIMKQLTFPANDSETKVHYDSWADFIM